MTRLRKLMLEELQRRNFSSETIRGYLGTVAKHFGKPPDRLGPDHIRQWQAHLLHERKLAVGTVVNHVAALRFFFRRVLKRRLPMDSIPYPKYNHHRTPRILSPEEVARLIEAAGTLKARAILMALYSTGLRRSELVHLRVEDIDSERMVIHVHKGKGGKDRDAALSQAPRNAARILALEETQDLALSRSTQSGRQAPDRQSYLACLQRCGTARRYQEARESAHVAA